MISPADHPARPADARIYDYLLARGHRRAAGRGPAEDRRGGRQEALTS